MSYFHPSAMLQEAVSYLNCQPGNIYVDGTLGGAGHAKLICERIQPNGRLIGIDQDEAAIVNGRKMLAKYDRQIHLFHDNFTSLPDILASLDVSSVDGILLDLGVSLYHFEQSGRGFSFKHDEPLDMRMDTHARQTAADLVNELQPAALERIFKTYGEERWARRIAKKIVTDRTKRPVLTSKDLARIVLDAVPSGWAAKQRIHPATRVFMALRIAVNQELDVLTAFLKTVLNYLNKKGRICILSFHSLEDRIVKQHFKKWAKGCSCPPTFPICVCGKTPQVRVLTPKVQRPGSEEVADNPMARSTRLRAIEKL
jgi:16S rRNA (cytosine1402-N4)-methyltransferase